MGAGREVSLCAGDGGAGVGLRSSGLSHPASEAVGESRGKSASCSVNTN